MTARDVIERLQATRSEWEPFGVAAMFLFGSISRGDAGDDSDIDLIVEFSQPVGLFQFIGLQDRLAELLGRRVDLVTAAALKPRIRDRVLAEAIRAA
jgi:predicted nucleotidyltransferase